MDVQEKFIQMMQDVVALAKMNGRKVTKEFLQDFFRELKLEKEQMEYVYQYLQQENIKVEGYEAGQTAQEDLFQDSMQNVEESEYLSLYLEELEMAGSKNAVDKTCYETAARGEKEAKAYVVVQKQSRVVEIAAKFKNKGLAQSDLIQEGNVALLLAVEQLGMHVDEAEEFIDREIENAMLSALDECREEKKENQGLIKKAENLKTEMERLSEDLGDKMTSDDVAMYTGMDLEEIQDILRVIGEET